MCLRYMFVIKIVLIKIIQMHKRYAFTMIERRVVLIYNVTTEHPTQIE